MAEAGVASLTPTRRAALAVALIAAILVLTVRIFLLARYSSSVPSWDAWGAEAMPLYGNWLNGEFSWPVLWSWHNDHRIFFTRLLDLGLFVANEHQWDVRVQTLASNLLFAGTLGLSVYWLRRHVQSPLSLLLIGVVVALGVLPNGWANTYQGFQSCFYFVILFSLITLGRVTQARPTFFGGVLATIFGLAAVFSLAAGVMAMLSAVGILALRVWVERIDWRRAVLFATPFLVATCWAFVDARKGELHTAVLAEFFNSLAIMLSWPFSSFFGCLLWFPAIAMLVRVLHRRAASKADLVFGGLCIWALLLSAAAAFSRAYNFTDVQSRYTDLLAPALVGQIYFAFRFAQVAGKHTARWALGFIAIFFTAIVAFGLTQAARGEFSKWRELAFMSRLGGMYVGAYVAGDIGALDGRAYGYIPHPEPALLKSFLNQPLIRSVLPLSVAPSDGIGARARACEWSASTDGGLPKSGHVDCEKNERAIAAARGVSVGRISAFTYWAWSAFGRRVYPTFDLNSEPWFGNGERSRCSVDLVNGDPVREARVSVPYANLFRLSGWIGPNSSDRAAATMTVVLENSDGESFYVVTESGLQRPDVQAAVGLPGFDHAGYVATMDGSAIPAGDYALTLMNEAGWICRSGITIAIAGNAPTRIMY